MSRLGDDISNHLIEVKACDDFADETIRTITEAVIAALDGEFNFMVGDMRFANCQPCEICEDWYDNEDLHDVEGKILCEFCEENKPRPKDDKDRDDPDDYSWIE